MISNQLTICLLAGGAALTTAALFVIILGPHLTRAWQRLTSPGNRGTDPAEANVFRALAVPKIPIR